ncbi:MAG: NAD-dependent epimerase/dehydratase family protein [Pirellulales bacterium]
MKIFVAGASGAIGRPLVAELLRRGHTVTGLTNSERGAAKLKEQGALVARASAYDREGMTAAVRQSAAEVVIDELTRLPASHAEIVDALAEDRRLRLEGGANLRRAARSAGVRRYIQQSSGFFLAAGNGLAEESERLATDATPAIAANSDTYSRLELRLFEPGEMEGVALRYGFFYGPGTWYDPAGACAEAARQRQLAIVGAGEGVWSWIHIDDAASATVAALEIPPGTYQIVDDDPLPQNQWLPAFARFVSAPEPPRITEEEARRALGEDAVYYATKLRGASNAKAKATFGFSPRRLEWLDA